MIPPQADALLAPVTEIDGFLLACLIDATTGMVLAAQQGQDDISLPVAAAGAADMANVLALLSGELAMDDGLEDVMVTFSKHFHVLRLVRPEPQILLLVILDRTRTNLALARREIRDFCASLAA